MAYGWLEARKDCIALFDPATPVSEKPAMLEGLERGIGIIEGRRERRDPAQVPSGKHELVETLRGTFGERVTFVPILSGAFRPTKRLIAAVPDSVEVSVAFMGYSADSGDQHSKRFSSGGKMWGTIYVPQSHVPIITGAERLVVVDDQISTWSTVRTVMTALHFQLGVPADRLSLTVAGWWKEKAVGEDTVITCPLLPYSRFMDSEIREEFHKPMRNEYGQPLGALVRA